VSVFNGYLWRIYKPIVDNNVYVVAAIGLRYNSKYDNKELLEDTSVFHITEPLGTSSFSTKELEDRLASRSLFVTFSNNQWRIAV